MIKMINWWLKLYIECIDMSFSFCFFFVLIFILNIFFIGGGVLFYELCV